MIDVNRTPPLGQPAQTQDPLRRPYYKFYDACHAFFEPSLPHSDLSFLD